MHWRWFIWSFIPGLHWMTWVQAGILTRHTPYYWLGFAYALPLLVVVVTKQPLLRLVVLSWLLGLAHAHLRRRDINQRIADLVRTTTSPEDLRQHLLQAALMHRGCLSVTQAVMETGSTFQDVERALNQMVESGYVFTRNHPDTGVLEYVFKEFL